MSIVQKKGAKALSQPGIPAARKLPWLAAISACLSLSLVPAGDACTLWGAAGKEANGGTIICKNRDWKPDHTQVLKLEKGKGSHTYFGLYAVGNSEPGIKEGVNDADLTVITASASSIPKKDRDDQPGKHGLIGTILSTCGSCAEVLARRDALFSGARASFYMISDRSQILMVEVGMKGKYAIKTITSGPVMHSNHFLEKNMGEFNIKIGTSSATRLGRITELMNTAARPYSMDLFAKFSKDQHDGPDNSLWRVGKSECTLSSWMVENPVKGPSKLRVVVANPGQSEQLHTYVLDDKFWRTGK